jgi:transcriptional regulator with XRE-family HTH domain
MRTVGELIKHRRDTLGLTRKDLSARLASYGVQYSVSAIAWWEGNRTNPPMHDRNFIEAMAKALDMTISEFLNFLGLVDADVDLSDDEKSLLEAYRSGDFQQAMRILSSSSSRKTH